MSGWTDSDYNAIAKAWRNRIPVVLTLDNWWRGSPKQWLAVLTALCTFKDVQPSLGPRFAAETFAEKLGFNGKFLATGFYCADNRSFQWIYERRKLERLKRKSCMLEGISNSRGSKSYGSILQSFHMIFPIGNSIA